MAFRGKHVRKSKIDVVFRITIIMLILSLIFAITAIVISANADIQEVPPTTMGELPEAITPSEKPTVPPTEPVTEPTIEETEPEPVIKTATIGSMGDLLMHAPLFSSQYSAEAYKPDGTYNFESLFKYVDDDILDFDFAVANLETTLCGNGNGYVYSGYPSFNCPDNIAVSAANAGFDMLLTANNHSSDTGMKGYKRTLEVVKDAGLMPIGTYASADEQKWEIVDVNGIDVGMVCYTYAFSETDGRPSLNGNTPVAEAGLCNYFCYDNLAAFYEEAQAHINSMNENGADVIMFYMHWGDEYHLTENNTQRAMAQKLCDMGVDVIVGGHPHVIQPMDLIESSTDPEHKTFCIYSTGNAVSNQRKGNISAISTAHTEDGIIFSVTFTQIDDEEAYVSDVSVVPTWVNMHTNENKRREYNIIPLHIDTVETWQEDFGLSENQYNNAKLSYERTMKIVGNGVEEIDEYLSQYASVG